jgi:DNA-binding protein YbaB
MKVIALLTAFLLAGASAFTVTPQSSTKTSSALHLFGGGDKSAKKQGSPPGMMDQLAMFKKAQEMATKKKKLDEELSKAKYQGASADGTVQATFKYVPGISPMDMNPDYETTEFKFDKEWFESAEPADIAKNSKEAVMSGIEIINKAVTEKYAVLQEDLMAAFGQIKQ